MARNVVLNFVRRRTCVVRSLLFDASQDYQISYRPNADRQANERTRKRGYFLNQFQDFLANASAEIGVLFVTAEYRRRRSNSSYRTRR